MSKATRVLVIDDDMVFCQLLEKGLKRLGYQAATAQTRDQALTVGGEIQVVLLDMRLGDESGLSLIEPLKQQHPAAKIIIVTGYASLATAVGAVKNGASNYIAKPIDVKSVHNIIQDSLNADVSHENTKIESATIPSQPLSLRRLEWEHIQRVLDENKGNISQTAKQLNMHRRTLQRKLKKRAPVDVQSD